MSFGFGGSNANNALANSLGKGLQDAATTATMDPQLLEAIKKYQQTGDLNAALGGIKGKGAELNADAKDAQAALDRNAAYASANGGNNQYSADILDQLSKRVADGTTKGAVSDNDLAAAIRNQMYSDPGSGTALATQQVQSNPLMSGFLGKGGIQDLRQDDERNLTNTAYDWNAQDETAFGTAAGNINRQYGAEQGNLARALAGRGFGASDSGVAGSQFAGLQGNVSDRLASMQQSLADNRMKVGMERLSAARNAVNQAQGIAQGAVNDQFNRNQVGLNRADKQVASSWNQAQGLQDQQNTQWMQQQASTINPLQIGAGIVTGAGSLGLGTALGNALGAGGGGLTSKKPTGTTITNTDSKR